MYSSSLSLSCFITTSRTGGSSEVENVNEAKREADVIHVGFFFLLMTAAAGPKLPRRCRHHFGSSRVCVLGAGGSGVGLREDTPLQSHLISEPGMMR